MSPLATFLLFIQHFLCILINVAVWLSVVQIYRDLFLHFANWWPSRWVPTFHFYQLCWMDTHVHVGESLYLKEELLGLRESIFSSLVVLNFSLKTLLPFILSSAAHRGPAALLSWEHLVLLFCFCFCFVFHFCQLMERLWGSPTNKTNSFLPKLLANWEIRQRTQQMENQTAINWGQHESRKELAEPGTAHSWQDRICSVITLTQTAGSFWARWRGKEKETKLLALKIFFR